MIPIMLSEDFEKIINHCNTCKSSYSIYNTVEGLLAGNLKLDRINLFNLMEYIEVKHPAVHDCDLKFYLEEINFTEQKFRFAKPKLVYLYTSVINEYEKLFPGRNSKKAKKALSKVISEDTKKLLLQKASEDETKVTEIEREFDSNKTFYSKYDTEELREKAQLFVDNEIMPKEHIDNFIKAFSEIPFEKKITKIPFKLEYNNKMNNQALVIILNHISPKEMDSNPYNVSKIKVSQLFSFTKPFSIKSTSFENAIKKIDDGDRPKNAATRKVSRILKL